MQVRNHLPEWFQAMASKRICEQIFQLPLYQKARHIALYYAVGREVALSALWEAALKAGKQCYFPVMQPDRHLHFVQADKQTAFRESRLGILEPEAPFDAKASACIELYFLPLIGFDTLGNRLGSGAGCYDRTLAGEKKAHYIGVAYAFQAVNELCKEPTDVPLDLIVTESGIIETKNGANE